MWIIKFGVLNNFLYFRSRFVRFTSCRKSKRDESCGLSAFIFATVLNMLGFQQANWTKVNV